MELEVQSCGVYGVACDGYGDGEGGGGYAYRAVVVLYICNSKLNCLMCGNRNENIYMSKFKCKFTIYFFLISRNI